MGKVDIIKISQQQRTYQLAIEKKDFFYILAGPDRRYHNEPYRTETFAIALLEKGTVKLQAGLNKQIVNAPALISVGPSVIRNFKKTDDESQLQILFFTKEYLLEQQTNVFFLNQYDFFEDNRKHVILLDSKQNEKFAQLFALISDVVNHKHKHESAIVRSYIFILMNEIEALHDEEKITDLKKDYINSLFFQFKALLEKEYLKNRSVSFYAAQLHTTPKYLSSLVKKQTGRTAGGIINEAIILEAKVLLQNYLFSIGQISDHLNFSDQSVFGKFFKINTGMSPNEYRRSLITT